MFSDALPVPRHQGPSGLRITPPPQTLTSIFSVASALFSHFSSPKCPTTLLSSDICALLPKQRRGALDASFLNPEFQGAKRPTSALSSLESALTQSALATPLESALTKYTGGWGTLPRKRLGSRSLAVSPRASSHVAAECVT